MKKLFFACLIFFTVSCGSGENSNTSENRGKDTTPAKGNSAGSNTIEMDTLHMDTSSEKSAADGGH